MALALSHRVALAWVLTILLLLLGGAGFAATQDNQLWVVAVLLLSAVLLMPFRSFFSSPCVLAPAVRSKAPTAITVDRSGDLRAGAGAGPPPDVLLLSNNAWWAVVMSREISNSVRFAVALAVVLGSIAIWLLVRPGRVHALPWDASAARRMFLMGAIPPAHADGMITGETDRAGLPFRRVGRVLLGLGRSGSAPRATRFPPSGGSVLISPGRRGLDPAFWRVGPGLLKVYADLGLTPLPLGSDGQIVQVDETMDPHRHYLVCVAERDLTALMPMLPELAGAPAE